MMGSQAAERATFQRETNLAREVREEPVSTNTLRD
jgi:hypothetical protein